MKVSKGALPEVDVKQAQRILQHAKAYHAQKEKIEGIIESALADKDPKNKNTFLRELRMML